LLLFISLALGYREFNFKINKEVMREIGKYSLIVGIAGLGFFLFTRVNILILGYFGYITEIGYYELVNKIILILLIPSSILAQVIAPDITSLYYKKDKQKLISKYKKYMWFSLIIGVITALFTFFAFPILVKYFLINYNLEVILTSMNLLLVLLISQSMSNLASVGFSTASGYAKLNMYFLLIFGVINVPLSIFLVKTYGFIGIIYSTLVIKLCADILFVYFYWRIIPYLK